jgi:uncharacterized protein
MNEGQPAIQPMESTSDDRLWALLAYLFTPIIPIILLFIESKKERPFIKYHNIHALVLGVAALVINMALGIVLIGICTSILTLGLFIYLGIKAYQGQVFEIPVITNFVKNQGWI